MIKKEIITIAGRPGSGKSTTSKLLAEALDYKHFSTGDLFRSIAKERGVDVYQNNVNAETDDSIDTQVDTRVAELGKQEDSLVIDSRMAWHWIPESFKVYLDLDIEIAAERILSKIEPERMQVENIPDDPHTYAEQLQMRLDSEAKRYMDRYEQNPYDTSNYDLVVNTHENTIDDVVAIILNEFKKWHT